MKYHNIREEELKNKVAHDYFWLFDCTKIIGDVDFCVCIHKSETDIFEQESLLWAEAKKGSADVYKSIVQLILTIGKARTFDKFLPPAYLGAFDGEKIAFIPYNDIHEVFYINDFNWNVTPSNYDTKEFKLVYEKVKSIIDKNALLFHYLNDDKELKLFVKKNFVVGKYGVTKTRIDKNNFMVIYNKWLQEVKHTIDVNWEMAKKGGIIDGDFYLADLLSHENNTLKEKLYVLLKKDHYELDRKLNEFGLFNSSKTGFIDKQVAHTQFWNRYERPPKEEYWDYIVERRDLLVPQDVRERKGSFFTPLIWVELSQKYLTDVLGEDWQDEYFVWDCAAGTGNLLTGLTNKYNIYASTLDKQDVEVMHDRIKNGANLLDEHVFQFDFLNDEFLPKSKGGKLPDSLYNIITNEKKRKKLVMYINPPYVDSNGLISKSRSNIQNTSVFTKYNTQLEKSSSELYAQFFIRINFELHGCLLAQFSKLKLLSGSNSITFRKYFQARLKSLFIVPADTFDNVKGKFPIGFFIWDFSKKEFFSNFKSIVYNHQGKKIGYKFFYSYDNEKGKINDWLNKFKINKNEQHIGILMADAPDFQHNNLVCIRNEKPRGHGIAFHINLNNIFTIAIYLSVRHCIEPTWLNDRDQFLCPNNKWEYDFEFKHDCLAFALFHGQNRITSSAGVNHWIPFTEKEINAREKFESNFMSKFLKGKISNDEENNMDLFYEPKASYNGKYSDGSFEFSDEAKAVFDAGKELWKYYHQQPNCNVNASLYDIREHFQGRNEAGKMNNKSEDETYTKLISNLREMLKHLAHKIEPKVYEYGFLKL